MPTDTEQYSFVAAGKLPHEWIFGALDDTEHLDGDNRYKCSVCGKLAAAERSVKYITSPAILTFHLKRFTITADAKLVFDCCTALCCIMHCSKAWYVLSSDE